MSYTNFEKFVRYIPKMGVNRSQVNSYINDKKWPLMLKVIKYNMLQLNLGAHNKILVKLLQVVIKILADSCLIFKLILR